MNQVYLFGPNNRLSNGSMTRFVLDDIWYNCVEQYMSSQKAKLFGDQEMYEKIMDTWSSQTHKELSRNVRSADPVIWDEKCEEIMLAALCAKCEQHPDIKETLLRTGSRIIGEATKEGIGFEMADSRAQRSDLWTGPNLLGKALMTVREKLYTSE